MSDQLFSSDSVDGKYTAEESRLEGLSWCSENNPDQPWLQIEFGRDVIISTIQTAGFDGIAFFNYYVIRYTVEIGNSTGELEALKQPNSSDTMVQLMI